MPNIHEILPLHDLLFGLMLPLAIAIVIYIAAMLMARKGRESAWAAPVAVGLGFATSYVGISGGMPGFPPDSSVAWLCYAGIALALVGVIISIVKVPRAVRFAVEVVVALAVMCVVTSRARTNGVWSSSQAVMWIAVLTIATTAVTWSIDVIAQRMSPALAAFIFAIVIGMTANVFGMSGSASLGKETGAIALTFFPVWTMALFVPAMSLRGAMPLVLGPLLTGVMVAHYLYSYSEGASPVPSLIVLASIPAVLCQTTMQWMRRRPRWQFVAVNLAVAVVPAAIAVAMVAIPFIKAMREGQNEAM